MYEWFEVYRNAEQLARAWGPIDYLYPHLKGARFKKGERVGVVVHDGKEGLRYGHMTLCFKPDLKNKYGDDKIYEEDLLTGKALQPFFKKHRCLVPVDSWVFKHKAREGAGDFSFHPSSPAPMCFGGVYSTFLHGNGTRINTVAIIGIASGGYYGKFCAKVPGLFLPGPEAIDFCNPKVSETKAWELLRRFPEEGMTVSKYEMIAQPPEYE